MSKRVYSIFLFFIGLTVLLVACGEDQNINANDPNTNNEVEEVKEDITLTLMMWDDWGQDYYKYIEEAIEEEFSHITIERVGGDTGNKGWIEEAIADGIIPDLIFAHRQYHVQYLNAYQLGYDMTELIEKHDFDLSRYDPAHLDEWKSWTNGEIWLLPFMRDIYALHYNKDVFDLFGVDYPTDDMTWPEVVELSKEVSGVHNDVQYQGIDLRHDAHLPLTQVIGQEPLIDPETDEVLWVDNPYVREWLEMVDEVYQYPDNVYPEDRYPWEPSETLGMLYKWFEMNLPENYGADIDLVTFPQWEDAPNVGPLSGGWGFGITEPSEHKDDAMEVLKFLYSDDHIMYLGETPMHAPFDHLYTETNLDELLPERVRDHYEGKNLEALYKLESPGGPKVRSKHDAGAFEVLEQIGIKYTESELDINSFLRELKEEEEIRIKEEKGRGY